MNINIPTNKLEGVSKNIFIAMLPRLQEKKTRSFVTLLFTLTAAAIFSLFAISPTLNTIAELNKQLDDSRFVDKKLQDKIAALSNLQQQYVQIKDNIHYVESGIPPEPDSPNFIAKVQEIALETKCDIIRIQIYPVQLPDSTVILPTGYSSFSFALDTTGSQATLSSFIDKLIGMDRLVTIDGLSIASTSQTSDQLRMNLKGNLYFKKSNL